MKRLEISLILRFFGLQSLILLSLFTTAQAQNNFEYVECSFGFHMPLHSDSNLPNVNNFHQRGVIESTSGNRFLDKATFYLEGIQVGSNLNDIRLGKRGKGNGRYEIIIMDEDGDMILGYEIANEDKLYAKFTHGTGKYEGIIGSYEVIDLSEKPEKLLDSLKEHIDMMPPIDTGYAKERRSYEICHTVRGVYEIKSK